MDWICEIISNRNSTEIRQFIRSNQLMRFESFKTFTSHHQQLRNMLIVVHKDEINLKLLNNWYLKYDDAKFIIVGGKMKVFPTNVAGFVENKEDLKQSFQNYIDLIKMSKMIRISETQKILINDILYCELKDRRLHIFTEYADFDIGYRILSEFVGEYRDILLQINRNQAINKQLLSKSKRMKEIKVKDRILRFSQIRYNKLKF